jgi:hypothetical protein
VTTVSESKPVRVLYAVAAGAGTLTTALVAIPQVPRWVPIVTGVLGAVLTVALGRYTQGIVTPDENVAARQLPSGKVIAGPAASQPDGTSVKVVRDLATGGPVDSGKAYLVGESGPDVPPFGAPFDTPPPTPGH